MGTGRTPGRDCLLPLPVQHGALSLRPPPPCYRPPPPTHSLLTHLQPLLPYVSWCTRVKQLFSLLYCRMTMRPESEPHTT